MSEKTFNTQGLADFKRQGSSLQENLEIPVPDFDEQVRKMELSGDADLIAEKYEFGEAVAILLKTHALKDLTKAVCERFLFSSDKFSEYHPGSVLAVAKAITKRQQANKPTEH